MKSHLDLSQRIQWSGEDNESLKLCNWALPCVPDSNVGLISSTGCCKIRSTFMYPSKACRTRLGSYCYYHVCSSSLTHNLDTLDIQAHTWSRCSERFGLWGITNRVWHLLLLTALLRMIGLCCFASWASSVQQQRKILRELWTLSRTHD